MNRAPVWLFNLDNTLHDASPHIFPHINRSMTAYVARHLALDEPAADALRVAYWRRYGATLLGLIRHHGTDPHHFLTETHRFESLRDLMVFHHGMKAMLQRLPGVKIVFSNGPRAYAESVIAAMGLRPSVHAVFGIEDMGFQPKPAIRAYRHLLRAHRLDPRRCVLVEDTVENLRTAKRLGMRTVWVSRSLRRPAYVDYKLPSVLTLRRLGLR